MASPPTGDTWTDHTVELQPTEFVSSVSEEDFPSGPEPPGGGSRLQLLKTNSENRV